MLKGCSFGTTIKTIDRFYLTFKFRVILSNVLFQNLSIFVCSYSIYSSEKKMDQWLKSCLSKYKSGGSNQQITTTKKVLNNEPNSRITSDVSLYVQGRYNHFT